MTGRWRKIYSEELRVIFSECCWDNVFLDAATLTEVFPCLFLGCKANARV